MNRTASVLLAGTLWAAAVVAVAAPQSAATQTAHLREHVREIQVRGWSGLHGSDVRLSAAVARFYQLRGYRLAWTRRHALDQLIAALEDLSRDGLDPAQYNLLLLKQAAASVHDDGGARVDDDLLATQSLFAALLHLYRGKVDPATLHARWNFESRSIDREAGLEAVGDALERGEVAGLFARARPAHPVYSRLRTALGALQQIEARGGWPRIADGRTLEAGVIDARIPDLRRRLALAGHAVGNGEVGAYDADLEAAVRRFQEEQYLEADGRVGPATRRALNVPVAARIAQMRVNLERARWGLPRITGDDLVLVDVAGYKVRYFRDGRPIFTSRVQVGRDLRRTPIFKAEITHVTLNPTWTVPPTILREDILPRVRTNPAFLAENHIRVVDGRGRELDAERVDWNHLGGLHLRQDPGPGNSLGRIRINFPNRYNVFLHETPHAELFGRSQRAFSSGCIRVEQPFELAGLLFTGSQDWNAATLAAAAVGSPKEVRLPRPVPILILYWTVDLHEDRVAFKPDVYGLDRPTLAALDQRASIEVRR